MGVIKRKCDESSHVQIRSVTAIFCQRRNSPGESQTYRYDKENREVAMSNAGMASEYQKG
jgi:hypothetical protein